MIYCGIIEKQFKDIIGEAEDKIEKEEYIQASSLLTKAEKLVSRLFTPQNLFERVQYLEVKSNMNERIFNAYKSISGEGFKRIEEFGEKGIKEFEKFQEAQQSHYKQYEKELGAYVDKIISSIKKVNSEIEEPDQKTLGLESNLKDTLFNLQNFMENYQEKIRKYIENKEKEGVNDLIEEIAGPITKLTKILGESPTGNNLDDLTGSLSYCVKKLEDLMG